MNIYFYKKILRESATAIIRKHKVFDTLPCKTFDSIIIGLFALIL